MKIILASKSPRRKEILENLGLDFTIATSDIEEKTDKTSPEEMVADLARQKGENVIFSLKNKGYDLEDTLIIACDTLVHFDGNVLGKPKDRDDAYRMLSALSDRSHCVSSGLYLYYNGKHVFDFMTTRVDFACLSEKEINMYLDTNEPYDKAGAYAIQGKAAVFIKGFEGDYFNVVGLPIRKLYEMARDNFDITLF